MLCNKQQYKQKAHVKKAPENDRNIIGLAGSIPAAI
jgi:hypothetical protein